ncbi:MAG: C40 family peptidase [Deltaproteobacteria bacterium]|nr:C40 family peptidase [Deltaproteobacteria bacterium]
MGYTIQVGAFSDVRNAARLTETLCRIGLDATYLAYRTGLYKVRFGNFPTKETAREQAEELKAKGVIEEFYIVKPEEYAVSKLPIYGAAYLRESIIKTAQSFIGVPYLWGGSSVDQGFDCSGLTMTVYRINGLDIPRTSAEQYEGGDPVDLDDLQKGDLIFFANGGGGVDHVGIYMGGDRFIHAPSRGKKVRTDSLSRGYFRTNYRGGRSYL